MRCLWLVGALLWSQVGLAQDCDRKSCGPKGKRDVRGCCLKVAKPSQESLEAENRRLREELERIKRGVGSRGVGSRGVGSGSGQANIRWVRLPGGSFLMGSRDGVGDEDEHPQRRVRVSSFELSKTEVTVAQYAACVRAGACTAPDTGWYCNWEKAGREDHPINCVDWHQARAFAAWVGGRLPTEAEWEYAARSGGRDQAYPWGDEAPSCSRAVMTGEGNDGCGRDSTWSVCSKASGNSAQGPCDLGGNVWEWVEDEKCNYGQAPTDGRAASCTSVYRVCRGGSWYNAAAVLRAANRDGSAPGGRGNSLGFRVSR